MKLQAFKVYLGRKEIDKVFYDAKYKETCESVKKSLVDHDGYNPNIKVVKERS
jgi:hypothetical protein